MRPGVVEEHRSAGSAPTTHAIITYSPVHLIEDKRAIAQRAASSRLVGPDISYPILC